MGNQTTQRPRIGILLVSLLLIGAPCLARNPADGSASTGGSAADSAAAEAPPHDGERPPSNENQATASGDASAESETGGATASIVVVVGAPGEEQYTQRFAEWTTRWRSIAQRAGARLTILGDQAVPADGPTVREQLENSLAEQAAATGEILWLVLIGHGTFDGEQAKFNIRGPDFSARELDGWLAKIPSTTIVLNCSSASSPFIERLSGPDRIVVTATRSGFELNATRFGDFLSQALVDNSGDLDKDDQTSLLEAFLYASREVQRWYEEEGLLATEHALLDDNGDRKGSASTMFEGLEPGGQANAALDGRRSHSLHLIPSPRERQLTTAQRQQRDRLEQSIRDLKSRKAELSDAEYYAELEQLLLELAAIYLPAAATDTGGSGM